MGRHKTPHIEELEQTKRPGLRTLHLERRSGSDGIHDARYGDSEEKIDQHFGIRQGRGVGVGMAKRIRPEVLRVPRASTVSDLVVGLCEIDLAPGKILARGLDSGNGGVSVFGQECRCSRAVKNAID